MAAGGPHPGGGRRSMYHVSRRRCNAAVPRLCCLGVGCRVGTRGYWLTSASLSYRHTAHQPSRRSCPPRQVCIAVVVALRCPPPPTMSPGHRSSSLGCGPAVWRPTLFCIFLMVLIPRMQGADVGRHATPKTRAGGRSWRSAAAGRWPPRCTAAPGSCLGLHTLQHCWGWCRCRVMRSSKVYPCLAFACGCTGGGPREGKHAHPHLGAACVASSTVVLPALTPMLAKAAIDLVFYAAEGALYSHAEWEAPGCAARHHRRR